MSRVDIKAAYEAMTPVERLAISSLHQVLHEIKSEPERYANPVQLIEDIEFTLQGLWKFSRDERYHTHWLEIKDCTCPQMDNRDPLYYGRGKIISGDCPWHWQEVEP